jgi:CheY-like chemotaxis protein
VPSAKRRVLVVDDHKDTAESLSLLLGLMGHETLTVHDGLKAVESVGSFHPDVVLLDIGLPKLNGYDAARRIREQHLGKTPLLIALSGWGREEDRRQSTLAGFDHHIVKPVDLACLEKLLALGAARDAG